MSNVVKWAMLAAGAIMLVGLVMSLPFVEFVSGSKVVGAINSLLSVCSGFLYSARGLINNFFTPFARNVLTALLTWMFGKWFVMNSIKIVTWVYHFIFRG